MVTRVSEQLNTQNNSASIRSMWGTIFYNAKVYDLVGDGTTNDYTDLYNLINTTINGADATIIFPKGTYKISSNITIPSNVSLYFVKGAMLSPDSGVTVTINGPVQADLWKIFTGSGTIAGSMKVDAVYPQWWGAKGDGVTDDTAAINAAISSGAVVFFPPGTYLISSTLLMVTSTKFVGSGKRKTIIKSTTAVPAIKVNGANGSNVYWWEIDGITLDGNGIGTIGLQLEYCHEGSFSRGKITGFQRGIKANWSFSNDITTCQVVSNSVTNVELGNQSHDFVLQDCQFDSAGSYGVHITAASQGVSLIGCVIQSCGKDGFLADAGYSINICGGYFENNNTSQTAGSGDIRLNGSVSSIWGTAITGVQIWTKYTTAGIVINDVSGVSIQGGAINNSGGGTTAYSIQTSASTVDGSVILGGILLIDPVNDVGNSIVNLKAPVFRGNAGVIKDNSNLYTDTPTTSTSTTFQQFIAGELKTNFKTDTDGQFYFEHKNTTSGLLVEIYHVTNANRVEWNQTLDMNSNFLVSPRLVLNGGTTGSRPASPATFEAYYDSTIGKPIWFNGTNWKDATGTTV